MFVLKTFIVFICAVISFNEARFVDTLKKCSIKDNDCQENVVSTVLDAIAKTGISELGIPPIDPFEIKDVTVSIMDLIEITAIKGRVKGIKDCVVESFITDIKKGHTEMILVCNSLTVKANYKLSGSSPIIKNLFGDESIHGEGNGKVKIKKLKFKFDYFYDVEKNKDGDIIFNCKFNKTIYTYDILGKVTFDADSIFLGKTDATQIVLGFLNENPKSLMTTVGRTFMDKAMEQVYYYSHKFFNVVPAKYYVLEDLSEYVKS